MATIIRQSYIDKIERYLGKGDSHRILRLGTQCIPNLRIRECKLNCVKLQ
jgi:hypothetical protein